MLNHLYQIFRVVQILVDKHLKILYHQLLYEIMLQVLHLFFRYKQLMDPIDHIKIDHDLFMYLLGEKKQNDYC
jgi:hypothetical protein